MKEDFQNVSGGAAPVSGSQGSHPTGGPSAADLPLPDELTGMLPEGDYVVEGFLGQGGMGAVYRGLQMPLRRPVAIKILQRKHIQDDYHFEDRFRREAYAMATLTHPNVVQVYDCGDAGDSFLFISMELVEGGDLSHAMKSGRVTPESALQLFIPICEGVQAAHDHGLVHRDIKPANIFLTTDARPKVADFGLAKKFDAQSTFMTQTGLGMGTPDYAAPEQYEELADLDHRADIYSLGVMFYQMLTGHLPRGAYKAPSRVVVVDTRLDAVVQKAMQTDRAERYQRVEEMRTEVEHIISTWMAPPKPRFVTQTGRVPTCTGRVPTHTGHVLTATGRVPTHTGHVPTVSGRVPTHTGRVPTTTGRVPIGPRIAPLHPVQPVPSGLVYTAQEGERLSHASPKKSGTLVFAGFFAVAAIIGGGAFVALRKPGVNPSAQANAASMPSSTSLATASPVQGENSTPVISPPPLPTRPVLQTLDLLALTDSVRDRISAPGSSSRNQWVRDGAALVYKSDGNPGTIAAPVAFECRDYEIELQVERLEGSGRLHLDLPVAGTRILPLILNDPNRRILNDRDGVKWPHNAPMLHVTMRVARGSPGADRLLIRDKISGKEILNWKGRLGQSGRPGESHPDFPGTPVVSLVPQGDSYGVRMWRLRVFEGKARELRTRDDSTPPEPSEILAFGGHRYQAVIGQVDWKAAKAKAEEMGGRLATIESREENDALKKAFDARLPAGSGLWIGASTTAGPAEIRWMSGGTLSFTAWATGEPNERNGAVMMMRGPRVPEIAWADFPFHGRGQTVMNRGFIVEWEDTGTAATPALILANTSTTPAPPGAGAPASATSSPAASSVPPPAPAFADPRLAQLESGFKSRYDADAQKPYATAVATLNASYLRALATARAAAQKGGNLAELTAIDEEAARTKAGRPPPPADVIGTPESVVKLRGTYRSAMARHAAARDKAAAPLYDLYLKALDGYIADLTKANNIARAKEVQDFRGEIAARKPVIDPPGVVEATAGSRPPAAARGAPAGKADDPAIEVSGTSSWRQLATWVLSMNGQLHVDRDGIRIQVTAANPKDLPSGRFSIRYVSLADGAANARLTDDDLTLLANAPDLEFLDIRDAPEITRLPALRSMKKLGRIMLHRCPKLDPGLFTELAGKQNLSDVDLNGSLTGVQGISALASCPKLANLTLSSTLLDDVALAEVGKLKSLRQLLIDNTRITDDGLSSIATLTALETLTLDGCMGVRGRTLNALSTLSSLKQLGLRRASINTENFPAIGRFVSLELLALDSMAGVDDEALAAFDNLPRLQNLSLYGTDVTGTGLASMKASKELKSLNLGSKAPVSNEGLQAISATFPALTELSLGDGGTWNANGLKALEALEDLKSLYAQGPNGRGDKELAVIGRFKQLDSLSMPNCELTDGGLARLGGLKLLASLDLSGAAALSDGAIPMLGKLRGLRNLQLRGTAITEAGMAALKKQLPSASIAR